MKFNFFFYYVKLHVLEYCFLWPFFVSTILTCNVAHLIKKFFAKALLKVCTHTDANKTCVIFVTLTVLFCRLGIPEWCTILQSSLCLLKSYWTQPNFLVGWTRPKTGTCILIQLISRTKKSELSDNVNTFG